MVRTLVVLAVVVALVAVGAVVGHAQWQKHQREVAHEKLLDEQQAYLDQVKQLDHRIAVDIAPVLDALAAMTTPKTGDILALRDALASPRLVHLVRNDYGKVAALRPPPGWEAHQADLQHAAVQMRDAVNGMYDDRASEDFDFLNTDLQTSQGGKLFAGVDDWRQSVLALFIERHEKAPTEVENAGTRKLSPTVTSWVFGADRACIRANLLATRLGPQLRQEPPPASALRAFASAVRRMAARLRSLPLPRAQAAELRRLIVVRLRAVDSIARGFDQLASAIDRHDPTGVPAVQDRLRTAFAAAEALASSFRRYHVVACVGALSTSEGAKHKKPVQA